MTDTSAPAPYLSPSSIDPSGATDVTFALNVWLANLPDGEPGEPTRAVLRTGVYRIDGTLTLGRRWHIELTNSGALLWARKASTLRDRCQLTITDGGGHRLVGLVIDGGHTGAGAAGTAYVKTLEGQHGIALRGVVGCELVDCKVKNTHADALYIYRLEADPDEVPLGAHTVEVGNDTYQWCSDIHVLGGEYGPTGRQGITVMGALNTIIEKAMVGECPRSIIACEPKADAGNGIDGLIIRQLIVGAGGQAYAFVTLSGTGPLANVHVLDCCSKVHSMLVYCSADDGAWRDGLEVRRLSSTVEVGNPSRAVFVLARRTRHLVCTDCKGKAGVRKTAAQKMAAAALDECPGALVGRNDLGVVGGPQQVPWAA